MVKKAGIFSLKSLPRIMWLLKNKHKKKEKKIALGLFAYKSKLKPWILVRERITHWILLNKTHLLKPVFLFLRAQPPGGFGYLGISMLKMECPAHTYLMQVFCGLTTLNEMLLVLWQLFLFRVCGNTVPKIAGELWEVFEQCFLWICLATV